MIKVSLKRLSKKKGINLPPKEELNYPDCPACLGEGHELALYIPQDPPGMIACLKKIPRSDKLCSLCKGKGTIPTEVKEKYLAKFKDKK